LSNIGRDNVCFFESVFSESLRLMKGYGVGAGKIQLIFSENILCPHLNASIR